MADQSKKPVRSSQNADMFEPYFTVLSQAQRSVLSVSATGTPAKKIDIEDEIAREKKIKNDDAEQDISLKRKTLERLFAFLLGETFVIFVFAYMQATKWLGFALEEWSFKLLIAATITQITIMLRVAIKYLFPQRTDTDN